LPAKRRHSQPAAEPSGGCPPRRSAASMGEKMTQPT
jgi:hypothetical protein